MTFSVVIDTDSFDVGQGQYFNVPEEDLSEEDWAEALRNYVGEFPEEVLTVIADDIELLTQVQENTKVELVEWNGP
jgi:hypothetical protein